MLAISSVPPPEDPACLVPIHTLVSSHLYGGQLSLEVSADGTRAFVADGAVIRIFNLTQTQLVYQNEVPVPDCQPLAQRHYTHPADGKEYLFLAGGGLGLWRILLSTGSYVPERIVELVGAHAQRKRCIDLAVLDAPHQGPPVLFALFAASSDTADSDIGASELRAFRLDGTSVVALATYAFTTTSGSTVPSVGNALATDPGDADSVYAAMGKAGIYRFDLAANGTLSNPPTHLANAWSGIDYVSDIAIVQAPSLSKSFLYAGLNFVHAADATGRIAEYDLSTGQATHMVQLGVSRPMRIAAVTDGGTGVRIAVAEHNRTVLAAETAAPNVVNGIWSGLCFGSGAPPDSDEPFEANDEKRVELFQRDLAADPLGAPLTVVPSTGLLALHHGTWGSLLLRRTSPSSYRLFTCTSERGTKIWDLAWSGGAASAGSPIEYAGVPSIGAQKGTVSLVNAEIVRFGLEGGSAAGIAAMVVHISKDSPYTITPISSTSATCGGEFFPPCQDDGPNFCAPRDTSYYQAAILGEAHWVDPPLSNHEYFFPTSKMMKRVTYTGGTGQTCTCTTIDDCSADWAMPCAASHRWSVADLDGATMNALVLGWRLVHMTIPASGSGTSGLPGSFGILWRQIQAPRGINEQQNSEGSDLGYSLADPRKAMDGLPEVVYGLRQGTTTGVKVHDPRTLVGWMPASGTPCDLHPERWGHGERISGVSSAQALTHIEMQPNGGGSATGCVVSVNCNDGNPASTNARRLYNNSADIYQMRTPTGAPKAVLAVAVGFPGAIQNPATGSLTCEWVPFEYHPMLDLFDITGTLGGGPITEPTLLQVGLGDDEGTAFDVAVKPYGTGSAARHYAFVADVTGKLLVFNVSYDQLPFSAPYSIPYPPNQHLQQLASLEFPKDPQDGFRTNAVDIEVDGDYLYCALGRAGIGIVNIQDPVHPKLCSVIDTPGLVLGITFRTLPTGQRQMIVGDSRCGIRIYEVIQ